MSLFQSQNRKFLICLHYKGSTSFVYANGVKIYQFKAKDTEIKPYPKILKLITWKHIYMLRI